MNGFRVSVILCLLLALAAAGVASCGDDTAAGPSGAEPPASTVPESYPPRRDPVPRDRSWIREHAPHTTLLLVANQRGKLKPCGCTEPQLGGLERLAVLLEGARNRAQVGFGALSMGWSLADHGEAQAETKANLYRAALARLGFDALLLGTTDLHVPALAQPFVGGRAYDLPTPPVNVPIPESGVLGVASGTEPFATFEVAGLPVRALTIIDPDARSRVGDVVPSIFPPDGALGRITPHLDALWIVATDATGASMDALRQAMTRLGPSIILDLSGATGVGVVEGARLGEPLVVTLAEWGKEAGILDLDPVPEEEGGGWTVSYHAVPLDPALEKLDSSLASAMTELFGVYKETVKERGYLASFGTYPNEHEVRYVGSSRCARCHPGIYESWVRTAHAGAQRTLEARNYHWDPECVRCHVVGFERFPDGRWGRVDGGFITPSATPHLGGVGCECCHGPGEAHVESPEDRSLFASDGPNRRDGGKRGCMICHDVENSFGFEDGYEADYLPRVDHRQVPSDRRTVYPPDGAD